MPSNFLSRKEAATYLGISLRTLDRYTKRNRLTYANIGRRVLYTKDSLDAFIKSCTIKAAPNTERNGGRS